SSISPSTSSPAARQNRSKLAVISSSARPTGERGTSAAGVLSLVMALLAPRGFSTPSLPAQGGQRRFPLPNSGRDIPRAGRGWRDAQSRGAVAGPRRTGRGRGGRGDAPPERRP